MLALTVRRHHVVVILGQADPANHVALLGAAGNDHLAGGVFATLLKAFDAVEFQVALVLGAAVALVAGAGNDRLDLFGEIDLLVGHRIGGNGQEQAGAD